MERFVALGRQAAPTTDSELTLEFGCKLKASEHHQQVSNCRVAVYRSLAPNEGVLDTTTQMTYEEKLALLETRAEQRRARIRMRTQEMARRVREEKENAQPTLKKNISLQRATRLSEFNSRVKRENMSMKPRPAGPDSRQQDSVQDTSLKDLTLNPNAAGLKSKADEDPVWWMQHGNRTFSDQQGELRQQRETCELSFCTPSKIQLDLSACELHYSQPATPELIKRGNDEEVRGGIETQEQGECVENVGANAGSVEQQQQQHGQQQATQQEQQQQSDEEWSEGCEEREEEQQEEDCTAAVPRVCTARARLLRHCVTAQQDAQQTGMQQSGEHLCQLPSAVAAASAGGEGDTTPRLARVFREVPHFMHVKQHSPPPMFRGHILPRYLYLSDKINIKRASLKAESMGLVCPAWCGCGFSGDPWNAAYTSRCARNCPMYKRPDLHEGLLNRFCQGSGII